MSTSPKATPTVSNNASQPSRRLRLVLWLGVEMSVWFMGYVSGRVVRIDGLDLVEKVAPVNDVVELAGRIAAGQIFDQFFERLELIDLADAVRGEVAGVAQAAHQLVQCEPPFHRQPAVRV